AAPAGRTLPQPGAGAGDGGIRLIAHLKDPGLDGRPTTRQTLVSTFQLMLPAMARSHRHTAAALRSG
ncbi:MAG TPA: hypothetical protein VIR57_08495, partial [Chloroflexota bacterium]